MQSSIITKSKDILELMNKALDELPPLFNISQSRLSLPELRRELEPYIHADHDRFVPGYSSIYKFIYMPTEDLVYKRLSTWWDWDGKYSFQQLFSQATIYHEMGHYIHDIINPDFHNGILKQIETGERPPKHFEWSETVAEYPCMILKLRQLNEVKFYLKALNFYKQHGPQFLPKLARMPLEEVMKNKYF